MLTHVLIRHERPDRGIFAGVVDPSRDPAPKVPRYSNPDALRYLDDDSLTWFEDMDHREARDGSIVRVGFDEKRPSRLPQFRDGSGRWWQVWCDGYVVATIEAREFPLEQKRAVCAALGGKSGWARLQEMPRR